MDKDGEFVKVLSVGDPFRIALAKSLLDEAGIPYLSQGEALQEMVGAGRFGGYNIAVGPVEFYVSAEHALEAREILEDLEGDAPDRSGEGEEDDDGGAADHDDS